MLRRALTYQLILAVAVGPLLCYCTAGNVSASAPPASSHGPAPAERSSSSCCSHQRVPAKAAPADRPVPAKPGQPAEKCPCKDGSGKPQTVQAETAQVTLWTFLRMLALDAVASFGTPDAGRVASRPDGSVWRRGSDCPRLTTDDLLYAHHNLRC